MKILPFAAIFCGLLLHAFHSFAQPQLTDLPTLYITTDNNQTINDRETWVPGSLKVVAGGAVPGLYDGRIEIRGRGNSTWPAPKKPYRIRLNPSKYNLLGMPSYAKNWVLLANYFDDTLLRTALAFEISKFLGFEYTCAYRFVDVFLNGTYIGNYTLTDHVQVENNRVEVEELDASDTALPAISGGYFVQEELYAEEEDGYFSTSHAGKYDVKYPDADDINTPQRDYIRAYIRDYENRLFSSSFLDPSAGYNPVVDRTSQVNWQIANELIGNPDAYLSVYLYKKRSDPKLYFGPVWDNDLAFNNTDRFADMTHLTMSEVAYNNSKIERMLLDPAFTEAIKNRWNALRSAGIYEHLNAKIPELAQKLLLSQAANFQLPNITKQPVSPLPFLSRVENLRTYLRRRIAFLDYQLTGEIRNDKYYRIANSSQRRPVSPVSESNHSIVPKDFDEPDLLQEWLMEPDGSGEAGYYRIKNRKTGLYLTRNNENVTAGALQPELAGQQRWKIEKIPNQLYVAILTPEGPQRRALAHEGSSVTLSANLDNLATSGSRRWFFIANSPDDTSLPVRLSSFRAELQESGVELSWNVTEASGFDRFEVEHTTDPLKISGGKIGEVLPREDVEGRYVFQDPSPEAGMNYYRLKLIDSDGTFSHTHYVGTEYSGIAGLSTYPVPAGSELNISFRSDAYRGGASVTLLTSAGKTALIREVDVKQGVNHVKLGVGNLSPGVYHLKMNLPNAFFVKRVVIAD